MNEDMMKNLENMLQNGQMPDELKNMINNFSTSKNANNVSTPNGYGSSNQNNDFDYVFESIKNSTSISNNTNNNDNSNPFSNIDINTIMKMKSIMDKMNNGANNPRANLLLSLKPYLKPSRKEKVDQYIKIFSMTEIFETFNSNGGENIK